MTTAPSGCHWCGVTEYDHGKLWSSATDDTGRVVGLMTTLVGISAFTGSRLLRKGQHR